jgi:hypothetical protein
MPRETQVQDLSIFQQQLIGTWNNQNLPGTKKGGPEYPHSYNVMPLPQKSPQNNWSLGYILKNFTYYETIVFKGPDDVVKPVAAPNRSDTFQQTPHVVFYDQQIHYAEGPFKDHVVHEENGAWLYLKTEPQQIGPYPYPMDNPALEPGDVDSQPWLTSHCKQISVPHGVSVQALGYVVEKTGQPTFPDSPPVLPTPEGLITIPYPYQTVLVDDGNYQNPQPFQTFDIFLPLRVAVAELDKAGHTVTDYIVCDVGDQEGSAVMNIPFEQRKAETTGYAAVYWLLSLDGGTTYDILAYAQVIKLKIEIDGTLYDFPHLTSNVLTKVKDVTPWRTAPPSEAQHR